MTWTLPTADGSNGQALTTNGTGTLSWATPSGGLPSLASTDIWVGNGSNVATAVAVTGNVTISNAGVTTIGAAQVTNAMLAGSIAASKLVGTDITTVGTITSGVWNAGAVTSSGGISGTTGAFTGAITDTQSIAATSTNGLVLTNTTAAANNAQQWSPRIHFTGQGWKTTATAASQAVDVIEELQPVQGAASPSGNLIWSSAINGGAYSPLMTLTTGGNVGIGTTVPGYLLNVMNTSLANDTSAQQFSIDTGADATLGAIHLGFGTHPSATGSNRYAYISSGDNVAMRPLILDFNGSSLYGNVGIGTNVPNYKLSVSANTAALPTSPVGGTVAQFGNVDGTYTRMLFDGFAAGSRIDFIRADTTAAAPSAVQSGEEIGGLSWFGYGTNAYSSGGRAIMLTAAAENWSNTAQGTYMAFYTTPKTTVSVAEHMRIDDAGNVGIGTTIPLANFQVGTSSALTNYQGAVVGIMLPTGSGSWLELAENSTNGTSFRISKDSSTGILINTNGKTLGFRADAYGTAVSGAQMVLTTGGNVGIGTTSPNSSVALDMGNTTGAIILPIGTTGQEPTGAAGMLRYNSTIPRVEAYYNSGWNALGLPTVPSFSVNRNGTNQTVTTNSYTKIQFNHKAFDTNSNFDAATNYRYTPTIAGKYLITLTVNCSDSGAECDGYIYKNGSVYEVSESYNSAVHMATATAVIDMNGTTDYVEGYAYNGGGTTLYGASTKTNMSGALLAGSDYAEYVMPENGTKVSDYEKGDLLCLNLAQPDTYGKCREPGETAVGVVSTNPGVIGNSPESLKGANIVLEKVALPMAMMGRVPVKVSLEGGPIKKGDRLSTSSRPGYAMKASGIVRTIGFALDDYRKGSAGSKVEIYIAPELTVTKEFMAKASSIQELRHEIEELRHELRVK